LHAYFCITAEIEGWWCDNNHSQKRLQRDTMDAKERALVDWLVQNYPTPVESITLTPEKMVGKEEADKLRASGHELQKIGFTNGGKEVEAWIVTSSPQLKQANSRQELQADSPHDLQEDSIPDLVANPVADQ
jgi:hypothetical protein